MWRAGDIIKAVANFSCKAGGIESGVEVVMNCFKDISAKAGKAVDNPGVTRDKK